MVKCPGNGQNSYLFDHSLDTGPFSVPARAPHPANEPNLFDHSLDIQVSKEWSNNQEMVR